jgi:ABC-type multidrug transport system fused ATPase/permease subunit
VPRAAFARARRFLHYRRGATWSALLLAVVLSLVYVGILCVLGLLFDLIVSRGVPAPDGPVAPWAARWLEPGAQHEVAQRLADGHGVGLVALAARSAGAWYEGLVSAPATWAWTRENGTYLSGLLLLLVVLAVVNSGLNLMLHSAAASAALEASYRLRRTVYLHTLRLGRLSIRGIGSGEALGTFTRDLDAVQEGLYHWLSVTFKEPIRFLFVLLFALVVDSTAGWPWVSLTGVLLAAFVWLVGGQLATYSRQRERRQSLVAAEHMALLQESLQLMRLVKGYGMENFNRARVERQLGKYGESMSRRYLARALYRQTLFLLSVAAFAAL